MLLPNNISSHIKECTAATCADSLLLVNKHVSDSCGGCTAALSGWSSFSVISAQ